MIELCKIYYSLQAVLNGIVICAITLIIPYTCVYFSTFVYKQYVIFVHEIFSYSIYIYLQICLVKRDRTNFHCRKRQQWGVPFKILILLKKLSLKSRKPLDRRIFDIRNKNVNRSLIYNARSPIHGQSVVCIQIIRNYTRC